MPKLVVDASGFAKCSLYRQLLALYMSVSIDV
jgi:hypothetical protein